MRFDFGFTTKTGPVASAPGKKFRLAVVGDFSARAHHGEARPVEDLKKIKPLKVDVDNLDDLLGRMSPKLSLPIGPEGSAVELEFKSMDDFHPDELCDNLEIFEELLNLRRKADSGRWESVKSEVLDWAEDAGAKLRASKKESSGARVATGKSRGDFAALLGKSARVSREEADVEELLKRVVGPYVRSSRDPQQDELVAAIDESLSDLLRVVLHHPEFRMVESLWRTLDLFTRRIETSASLEIVVYDMTAAELAADLSADGDLEETAAYRLFVEQPAEDERHGPLSVICGLFTFERTPPHAELLGRAAKIGSAAGAPFVAGLGNDALKIVKPDEEHELVVEAWEGLAALPEAQYVGLAGPRFMLRHPYGAKTDPIDPFDFEEFSPREGTRSMLYANGAALAGLMLALTYQQAGSFNMRLGSVLAIDDVPYHFYTDSDGDQQPLPCTDRLLTQRVADFVLSRGIMPVLSIKGRPEVRLGGFVSVMGDNIAGPWGQYTPPPAQVEAKPMADEPAIEDEVDTSVDDADDSSGDGDEEMDPELAALLADLGDDDADDDDSGLEDSSDDDDDDEEMDPELAALLAELDD